MKVTLEPGMLVCPVRTSATVGVATKLAPVIVRSFALASASWFVAVDGVDPAGAGAAKAGDATDRRIEVKATSAIERDRVRECISGPLVGPSS
jgi:hypothetical protein